MDFFTGFAVGIGVGGGAVALLVRAWQGVTRDVRRPEAGPMPTMRTAADSAPDRKRRRVRFGETADETADETDGEWPPAPVRWQPAPAEPAAGPLLDRVAAVSEGLDALAGTPDDYLPSLEQVLQGRPLL